MPGSKLVLLGTVVVAAVAGPLAWGGPTGQTISYKAALTAGAAVPKPLAAPKARGSFSAAVTGEGAERVLVWSLRFSGLSGKAVAAHLHRGKPGGTGAVVLPLCGPCRSGAGGRAAVPAGVAATLQRGAAYVNVHTARNAAGEIRGQARLVKRTNSPGADPAPTPTTPEPSPGGGGGGGYPEY